MIRHPVELATLALIFSVMTFKLYICNLVVGDFGGILKTLYVCSIKKPLNAKSSHNQLVLPTRPILTLVTFANNCNFHMNCLETFTVGNTAHITATLLVCVFCFGKINFCKVLGVALSKYLQ